MDPQELRALPDNELEAALENARQEMFNLRFQHATGRLADTSRLRTVRREIARLQTIQRERAIWAEYSLTEEEEA